MIDRPIASFHFDPFKTWPFMIMLLAMIALGLGRVWTHGLAEAWGIAFLLVVLPAVALAMVIQELRLAAPVLTISEAGILDRRRGPDVLPWSAIQEATIKRRVLNKGIRIVLASGERHDIELNLIKGEPALIMRLIQEHASRHAA
jgi:hypothetical protein